VETVAMRLVSEAVELGANLPELSEDELLVAATFVRCRVHDGALKLHLEPPGRGANERHRGIQRPGELDDFAGLDQLDRVEHGLRLHVVCRTPLVSGPPFRGTPRAVARRRPSRRLPSTSTTPAP